MKKLAFTVMILFSPFFLFGLSLADLLPNLSREETARLEEGKSLKNNSEQMGLFIYMPSHELTEEVQNYFSGQNPEMFLEAVYLLPSPPRQENLLLHLFNNMRAISDQEGLQYRSYNRGNRMFPLIEESWFYDDPAHPGIPSEDPVVTVIPELETLYAYQEDTTFGKNEYLYRYRASSDAFSCTIRNLTPLKVKGLITAAEEEELYLFYLVIPVNEGIFCYTIAFIQQPPRVRRVLGMEVNIVGSFYKRIDVIIKWFKNRIS
jgi:hypothetical protein